MARIRIVTKVNPAYEPSSYPVLNRMFTDWTSVYVSAVDDDGTEHPLPGVKSVLFAAGESPEALQATLTFYDVDVDIQVECDEVKR